MNRKSLWIALLVLALLTVWVGSLSGNESNVFEYRQFAVKMDASSVEQVYYYASDGSDDSVIDYANEVSVAEAEMPNSVSELAPYVVYDTYLTQASYIAVGDLEGDGYNDVVSTSYYDGYLAVLHQTTDTHKLELVALWDVVPDGVNGAQQVYIADLNGDCRKDILVWIFTQDRGIILWQTPQYGVFEAELFVPGTDYWSGGIGDVNGDGFADIIWSYIRKVWIGVQTATRGFQISKVDDFSGQEWLQEIKVGDVDGDGKPDIVAGSMNVGVVMWKSSTGDRVTIPMPAQSMKIALGDLDGDGYEDVGVSLRVSGQVGIIWGGSYTTTVLPTGTGQYSNVDDVSIGDINGDGAPDLVAGDVQNYHLIVWTFEGRTTTREIVNSNVIPGEMEIRDINGDGLDDVIYGLAGHTEPPHAPISVHYQLGEGSIEPRFPPCKKWSLCYIPLVVK